VIRVDVSGSLESIRNQLGATQREASKAASRALNRTASRVRTYAARGIRDAGYNLKVGDIKKQIRVVKASPVVLAASVIASGRSIPLINYSARQTSDGVSVNVRDGRKVIKHAFLQTMHSGHRGVFIRREVRGATQHIKGTTRSHTGRTTKHGLPIDELFGPSIPAAFSNAVVQQQLIEQTTTYFPTEMRRQLQHVLESHA